MAALLKLKAKSAMMRQEAVLLNRRGFSNEQIAEQLAISTRTVQRHLNRFLESGARYPAELSVEAVKLMRAQAREDIEASQRRILQRLDRLMTLEPGSISEETRVADSLFKGCDSYLRGAERIAEMCGLNAPRDGNGATVNNNLLLNVSGTSEVQVLRDLARLKEIQLNGSAGQG
jgi:DNA-binding Lrp family transcriptional regulator